MQHQYSIAQARDRLARIVHDVEKGRPISLTRRGRTVAVLLSAKEFQRLREDRPAFWTALQKFRQGLIRDGIEFEPAVFSNVRDRSPGREFTW